MKASMNTTGLRSVTHDELSCAELLSIKGAASTQFETTIATPIGELTNENKLVVAGKGSTGQYFEGLVAQEDGVLTGLFAAKEYAARRASLTNNIPGIRFVLQTSRVFGAPARY